MCVCDVTVIARTLIGPRSRSVLANQCSTTGERKKEMPTSSAEHQSFKDQVRVNCQAESLADDILEILHRDGLEILPVVSETLFG